MSESFLHGRKGDFVCGGRLVDRVPLLAVWLSVVLPIFINLIGLGSYQAVSAIFNVATAVLDLSYVGPISCKMAFSRFENGPWNLGIFGTPIHIYSVVWTLFITVLFFMLTFRPVPAANVSQLPERCSLLSSPANFRLLSR